MLQHDDAAIAEPIRRQQLAYALARGHVDRILATLDGRTRAIVQRFEPDVQDLVRSEWPVARQVLTACLPDLIEVLLDVLAEGFSTKLLDQVARRCIPNPTDTPSSCSPPASSASSPPGS